jgi:hypothetical protein
MAFHSVNRWCLFTSPEHYCTHNCHNKHTKSKSLSDTVQFQHKRITNLSITHMDKVMCALANCVKAIHGMAGKDRTSPATKDLQHIVDTTQAHIKAQLKLFEHTATPTDNPREQRVPRVQTTAGVPMPHTEINRRVMRVMSMSPPVPRVPSSNKTTSKMPTLPTHSTSQVHTQKWRTAQLRHVESMINTTPRVRTQAQVATEIARTVPPASNTQSRVCQSTLPPLSRRPGFVAAIMQQQRNQRGLVRLSRHITHLENEVHQALAVLDEDMGKLLNYRRLMRSTKHKKAWSLSSANELGKLANGIGGRIKNPTNTIEFICLHKVPTEQKHNVMYGQIVGTVQPKKG